MGLVAGIDVSGNPEQGNYLFLAIVIGTEEKITSMARDTWRETASNLHFDGQNCTAFCFRIEFNKTVEIAKSSRRTKARTAKAFDMCYRALWKLVRDDVLEFMRRHRCAQHEVLFQCDSDCRQLAKVIGLKFTEEGAAHKLADIVAWAINNQIMVQGVISKDIADPIRSIVMRHLRR